MNLPAGGTAWSVAVVVVITLIAQLPGIERWLEQATRTHEHVVTVAEGLIGLVLVVLAGAKRKPAAGAK